MFTNKLIFVSLFLYELFIMSAKFIYQSDCDKDFQDLEYIIPN